MLFFTVFAFFYPFLVIFLVHPPLQAIPLLFVVTMARLFPSNGHCCSFVSFCLAWRSFWPTSDRFSVYFCQLLVLTGGAISTLPLLHNSFSVLWLSYWALLTKVKIILHAEAFTLRNLVDWVYQPSKGEMHMEVWNDTFLCGLRYYSLFSNSFYRKISSRCLWYFASYVLCPSKLSQIEVLV